MNRCCGEKNAGGKEEVQGQSEAGVLERPQGLLSLMTSVSVVSHGLWVCVRRFLLPCSLGFDFMYCHSATINIH